MDHSSVDGSKLIPMYSTERTHTWAQSACALLDDVIRDMSRVSNRVRLTNARPSSAFNVYFLLVIVVVNEYLIKYFVVSVAVT